MDFSSEIAIFDSFIKENYDYDNELIKTKYIHTLNVVKVILSLSQKLGLNEEDRKLAFYLALFHDLGRFREVVRQNEFNNLKFDHGAYSNKILFNDGFIDKFNIDEKNYLLIKKAVYLHNKKDLPDGLSDKERLFCEMLRDADRIDIYRVLSSKKDKKAVFDSVSNESILESFYNGDSIDLKDIKTKGDRVVLRLGFVNLFSFPESGNVLKELGYLDDYINSIEVKSDVEELFNSLIQKIRLSLEGEKKYVRQKI